jgi:hypothetical protein
MTELNCTTIRELAPELALDVLTGYERAEAQAHLGTCPQCQEYLGGLTRIGDRLLTLVPGVEPPVGFEDRALSRMGFLARRLPRRPWLPVTVAAAVVVALLGFGGWAVGSIVTGRSPAPVVADMRFAPFRGSDQHQVGQLFTYDGSTSWVYMSVTNASATTVTCQLEERNGTTVSIGSFPLSGGRGFWGREIDMDQNTVVGARLVTEHGAVLATATFGS